MLPGSPPFFKNIFTAPDKPKCTSSHLDILSFRNWEAAELKPLKSTFKAPPGVRSTIRSCFGIVYDSNSNSIGSLQSFRNRGN